MKTLGGSKSLSLQIRGFHLLKEKDKTVTNLSPLSMQVLCYGDFHPTPHHHHIIVCWEDNRNLLCYHHDRHHPKLLLLKMIMMLMMVNIPPTKISPQTSLPLPPTSQYYYDEYDDHEDDGDRAA